MTEEKQPWIAAEPWRVVLLVLMLAFCVGVWIAVWLLPELRGIFGT
jgi:hypothetical protein